ncbi:hypothetical protein [Shewanella colwelliana]|uniref:hypothetical protein n=1 Tax=Shewanella colwelliana TaxID=23 RepID=UPI0022AF0379|nr:hypothetical protein [Shewanella colwelliana]MCZ4337642.1 hypothetical protein [Shewanella colwelliana]
MKIIKPSNIKIIRKELKVLLEKYNSENEHGLTLSLGDATYNEHSVTFKTTATIALEGIPQGIEPTPEAASFLQDAKFYGLQPSDLGREFVEGKNTYRIVGLKPKNRSLPIIAVDLQSERQYKFAAKDIQRVLGY